MMAALQRDLGDETLIAKDNFVSSSNLTMTLKTNKQRKRRSTPKSRNGCYSCKIRRVKCDETKPAPCARCAKFGTICDGYPDDKRPPTQQSILPKDIRNYNGGSMNAAPNLEAYYFDCYLNQMANQIGAPLSSNLLLETVPHVSRESPSIRHLIIALGALIAARHEMRQKYGHCDEDGNSHLNKHHQRALQQYSKALKAMQEACLCSREYSIQPLIASLLVFCFEFHLGHHYAASAHASSSVSLISQLRYKRLDGRLAFSNLNSSPIDMELYAAFSNLDLQALLFVDNRPATTHQNLLTELNGIIQEMPDHFSEICICRNYFYVIIRRNLHFIAITRAASPPKERPDEAIALCYRNSIMSSPPIESRGDHTSLFNERELCMKDIRRWESASATLLEDTSPAMTDDQSFLITNLLKIHTALITVLLSRTFYSPEIATDRHLPEFKTIVDLSYSIKHILIPAPFSDNAPMFRCDIGILPALFQVGLLCRDKEIRDRAIALLLDNPGYREAIWEVDAIGQICRYVREMEEIWRDENGFIPGDRRATMTGMDFQERSCKAEFMERMGPRECDVVIKTECFTLPRLES